MNQLERAKTIVRQLAPDKDPEYSCMLIAAAIAGMRRLSMRHIRIGSLWWPDKFNNADPDIMMRGGWGCEGFDVRTGTLWLADEEIDPDGGFRGHTWLESEPESVIDLMHDNECSARDIYNSDFKLCAKYIRRTKLERAVKSYWRSQMTAAINLGRRLQ